MRSIPEIQEEGRISGLVLRGTEWLRQMRSFLQVKRSNKVALLQNKEPPVTPVVPKLFMTVPKPEVSTGGNKRGGSGSPRPSAC
ncbi:Hypothetical predicted protein [Podarcis lilfordi]|uniref:Uncharacterized protein n=1 Tax=Podarcis lilfordi TaxID=74358 RepID=A0AA35KWY8_9SAUR|nr:Hypothetical predicted protein [Podarcis lilfordi]